MHTVLNPPILQVLFAIVASFFGLAEAQQDDPTPTVTVVGATAQQAATLDQALASFEAAGLTLSSLSVEFHDTTDACKGNGGLFRHGDASLGTKDTVIVCHRSPVSLLHELGHAWVKVNLPASARTAFMNHVGETKWNDQESKWSQRASERAANTIAHTMLLKEPTDFQPVVDLVCSYELLVGSPHENLRYVDCPEQSA